jgi:hypothetical protein
MERQAPRQPEQLDGAVRVPFETGTELAQIERHRVARSSTCRRGADPPRAAVGGTSSRLPAIGPAIGMRGPPASGDLRPQRSDIAIRLGQCPQPARVGRLSQPGLDNLGQYRIRGVR